MVAEALLSRRGPEAVLRFARVSRRTRRCSGSRRPFRCTCRPQARSSRRSREGGRVLHGRRVGVVVEVDVYIGGSGPGVGDSGGPGRQGPAAVVGPGVGPALVEAEVGPVGGAPEGVAGREWVSAQQRAAPWDSRTSRISGAHQESWRGSTAIRVPEGKQPRQVFRRSASARSVGGSCSRIGPSRSPRPCAWLIRRCTGSSGSRSRLMWVRYRLAFTATTKSLGTLSRHASKFSRVGSR